jgi:hypothetical protein
MAIYEGFVQEVVPDDPFAFLGSLGGLLAGCVGVLLFLLLLAFIPLIILASLIEFIKSRY